MSTIGTLATLSDHAKRLDPDGKTAAIVEILSESNEMLEDMMFKEGNLPTGHRVTLRTGLPAVYWRMMNKGVPPSKSTTAQVDEQCGLLEARSEVDVEVMGLNGNSADYRLTETSAFMEAMSQEMQETVAYGSAASPAEFVGLANRYGDKSAVNGQNIIDAGGTGSDNSSIYLIGWGEKSAYGVFPKGSKAGIEHEDLGIIDAFDENKNRFRAYADHFKWKNGLVVKDWRYIVRIANLDVSTIVADEDGSTTNLVNLMLRAVHRLPMMSGVRPAFYTNRTIKEMLDIQASNKASVHLNSGEEEGKLKTTLRGIPIRTVDKLTEAEAQVT